jgi:hypothetical protein
MPTRHLLMALAITVVIAAGGAFHSYEKAQSTALVRRLSDQLEQTKSELANANVRLADANKKLRFLEHARVGVQVTAYALTDDFGPDPVFSNDEPARKAYAVPTHKLPAGKVLNVALSPAAERNLHANLNDTLVLLSRRHGELHLARFVDRTAQDETRPVVDILFADAHEARIWGRKSFYVGRYFAISPAFSAELMHRALAKSSIGFPYGTDKSTLLLEILFTQLVPEQRNRRSDFQALEGTA